MGIEKDFQARLKLVNYAREYGIEKAAEWSGRPEGYVRRLLDFYEEHGEDGLRYLAERAQDARHGQGPKERWSQSLPEFYAELARDVLRALKGGPSRIYGGVWRALAGFVRHSMREQRMPARYVIPSVLLHVVLLFLLAYASTVEIKLPEEPEEEFTYVGLTEEPEKPLKVYESEEAETGGGPSAGEDNGAPGRKGVETSGPEKGQTSATGPRETAEPADTGSRGALGEKARASLDAAQGRETAEGGLKSGAEKKLDVTARAAGMDMPEAGFTPGELKITGGGAAGKTRAGAAARSLTDKGSPDARAAGPGPGQAEARGGGELAGAGRKSAGSLGGGVSGREPAPDLKDGKRIEIDSAPGRGKNARMPDAVMSRAPGRLDMAASGGNVPGGSKAAGGGAPKSVERAGGAASAAGGIDRVAGASGQGRQGPAGGSKSTGRLGGVAPGGDAVPEFGARSGKEAGLEGQRLAKRFAADDGVPGARKLDISAGSGTGKQGGGRPSHGISGPSGIGERGAAGPSAGNAFLPEPSSGGGQAGTGGYSPARGSGKQAGQGTLEGGTSSRGGGAPGPGSGEKSVQISRAGGGSGKAGVPDASPGRLGGLGDMIRDFVTGGKSSGQGKQPGGTGGGVRLGSGKKSGGGPAGTSAIRGGEDQDKDLLAGDRKRTAYGTLGVPGGSGKERYATAEKTRPGAVAPEKQSGVGTGAGRGGKGFGPGVRITSPGPGTTGQLTQVVRGSVSDPRAKKATLTVNDDSRVVSVAGGKFEATVALKDGRNVITVMAFDQDGNVGKDSVTLSYKEPPGDFDVTISEPRNGQLFDVSKSNTVKVKGVVGNARITRARMVLNGNAKDIVVKGGRFTQEVALTQEQNTVMVEAVGANGAASASRVVRFGTMNISPKDVMIVLTWDRPNADLDLHVYDPLGGHTSYKSPNVYESNDAISGGQLEQDAKGNFGPEVFTQEHAAKGVYSIRSNYYYSGGDGDANATVTVILYGDNPARRIVRVFGPHLQVDSRTGEETWDVARFKMPEGIFLED